MECDLYQTSVNHLELVEREMDYWIKNLCGETRTGTISN